METVEPRHSLRVYLGMTAAVAALASSSIIVTSLEQREVAPIVVAFYRMAIATLILAPVAIATRRAETVAFARHRIGIVVLSGFCLAVHFGAWIASLKYLPISTSVVLVSSHPMLVVLASRFFLNEIPSRRSLAGIGLGLCGTAVVCWTGLKDLNQTLRGDLLALLGALALCGYVIIGRKSRTRVTLLAYVTPVYLLCSLLLIAGVIVSNARLFPYGRTEWLGFGLLALVPTVFGHTLMNWALRYVRASVVSAAFLGEPVLASVLALIFFEQAPGWSTVIGGSLILIGIYLTTSASRPLQARSNKPNRPS
ncbi:MAG TPA: DMT family transporter [Blastocatellia bacterium]|nr:DMT family transporter [Blastocatellia bacterium]